MAATAIERITIDAPAGRIYDLVADVARMGEFSPEATGARGGSSHPTVGDRFVGTNRHGPFRWFTFCTVRDADRGERFAFDVDFGPFPISHWSYDFEPVNGGTRVTESWTDRRAGVWGIPMRAVGQVFIPGNRTQHNHATMAATLRHLKAEAERD